MNNEIIVTIRRDKERLQEQKPFIEKVETLINHGVNTFRFNLEKWKASEIGMLYEDIRAVREKYSSDKFKVLLDIPYPGRKARIITENGKNISLKKGGLITIASSCDGVTHENADAMVTIDNLGNKISEKQFAIYGDGSGKLIPKKILDENVVVFEAFNDVTLEHTKAITFPGSSECNQEGLQGIREIIDHITPEIVALSFVEEAGQIDCFKENISDKCSIMAKIETEKGALNAEEIAKKADSVMIARGDLGLNVPTTDFIKVQLKITEDVKKSGKKVYVATNVLNSMVTNQIPVRTDISDLYLIKKSGAHGVVLTYDLVRSEQIMDAINLIRNIKI